MEEAKDKIFFAPGDIVELNKEIPNRPIMYVVKKESRNFKAPLDDEKSSFMVGIKCRWFTVDGKLQEAIFNTKDLKLV